MMGRMGTVALLAAIAEPRHVHVTQVEMGCGQLLERRSPLLRIGRQRLQASDGRCYQPDRLFPLAAKTRNPSQTVVRIGNIELAI